MVHEGKVVTFDAKTQQGEVEIQTSNNVAHEFPIRARILGRGRTVSVGDEIIAEDIHYPLSIFADRSPLVRDWRRKVEID